MKNLVLTLLSLIILAPGPAVAMQDEETSLEDVFADAYLGFKYGQVVLGVDLDYDDTEQDLGNFGIILGNRINENFALELEYTQTVHQDDGFNDFDVEADTIGLFLVGKTSGQVYFKGKLGYARVAQHFDFGAGSTQELDGDKNVYGLAYGIGAGARVKDFGSLELELTVYPVRDDVEFDFGPISGTAEDDLEMHMISLTYILSVH